MYKQHFQNAFQTGKRTLGHIWNTATKFAGDIDYSMKVGKRLFAALEPLLSDAGFGQTSRAIVQGFGQYERGRDEVIGLDNKVQGTLNRLRRNVPELEID